MRRVRRAVVTWIVVSASGYVLIVLLFALCQDTLVFPGGGRGDRGVPDLPDLEVGTLERPGGGSFRIVTAGPRGAGAGPGAPPAAVAVYFVGNGEDLYSAARGAALLAEYGLLVVGVEHAGYGTSDGPTNVATLLAGAEAAAAHAAGLAERHGVPLVSIGSSLGTFCAVHAAARGGVDRLVLRAPPTSLRAVAKSRFFWLPIDWFLRHDFDNLAAADRIACPVLIVHGGRDRIVPARLGEQLAAAIGDNARLVVVPGYGHNDLSLARGGPVGDELAAFLRAP